MEINAKNYCLTPIFSHSVHVFQQIKNPHISSMQDTPTNFNTKFGFNWSNSIIGKDFERNTLKIAKKSLKKGLTDYTQTLARDRSHHAEHLYPCQNLAKPNCFGDICQKLLSDPYVLFLATAATFFDESKSPHQFYAGYPKEHSYQVWFYLVQ